jgi:hypothetical protein
VRAWGWRGVSSVVLGSFGGQNFEFGAFKSLVATTTPLYEAESRCGTRLVACGLCGFADPKVFGDTTQAYSVGSDLCHRIALWTRFGAECMIGHCPTWLHAFWIYFPGTFGGHSGRPGAQTERIPWPRLTMKQLPWDKLLPCPRQRPLPVPSASEVQSVAIERENPPGPSQRASPLLSSLHHNPRAPFWPTQNG